MKKLFPLLLLLVLFVPPCALAQDESAFTIDDNHIYDNMSRPYQQGYVPVIRGNTAYIVLPLLSDSCEGDITAEFTPQNLEQTPVKLSNQFTQTVKRSTYTFAGEKVRAYKVYFKLALYSTRMSGEYPCTITISGKDADGHALTQSFPLVLRVSDGQANDTPPDVGIDSFDAGEAFYVGGNGRFKITMTNRSSTREARDIVLTMVDGTGDILPEASSLIPVGTLLPGESIDIDIPVTALAKGAAQSHSIEFSLSYGYADGKTGTKSEKHTVDLQQEVRLNHTEATLPQKVTQGENVAFNITLMNMGKGTLYNALLTFDVPSMAAGGSVLVGTIEPGKSSASTANLRVDGNFTGETSGTLTITWEDGYGEPYEKTLPLSTTVIEKVALVNGNTGISGVNADSATNAKISIRELCAWGVAGLFMVLFSVRTIVSMRKIRKLEEKQL